MSYLGKSTSYLKLKLARLHPLRARASYSPVGLALWNSWGQLIPVSLTYINPLSCLSATSGTFTRTVMSWLLLSTFLCPSLSWSNALPPESRSTYTPPTKPRVPDCPGVCPFFLVHTYPHDNKTLVQTHNIKTFVSLILLPPLEDHAVWLLQKCNFITTAQVYFKQSRGGLAL
jgi:hypothetical protein